MSDNLNFYIPTLRIYQIMNGTSTTIQTKFRALRRNFHITRLIP